MSNKSEEAKMRHACLELIKNLLKVENAENIVLVSVMFHLFS